MTTSAPKPAGLSHHPLREGRSLAREDGVGVEALRGHVEPGSRALGEQHLRRAPGPGQLHVHAARGSRAHHQHRVAGAHRCPLLAVDAAGEKLRHRGVFERHAVGDPVDEPVRHDVHGRHDVLREAARARVPDARPGIHADVAHAGPAPSADPAPVAGGHGDPVADRETRCPVAERLDDARDLVSDDARQRGPGIALAEDADVRAADGARLDPDSQAAGNQLRIRHVLHLDDAQGFDDGCFHGNPSCRNPPRMTTRSISHCG